MAEGSLNCNISRTRGADALPLVDYVLLAEFDIDTGSTLRLQYPTPIENYKADWFAEHMLPEGAHNRDLDYTYMILNRDGVHIDDEVWIKPTQSNSDSKAFLHGINLVKTRHDSNVRRGAIVKAMCIFSRYSFLEVFKQPLELALDNYFDNPSLSILENLFADLNSVDLSSLPRPNYLEMVLMRRGVHHDNIRPPYNSHKPNAWSHTLEYTSSTNDGKVFHLVFPLYQTPDEIGNINVTKLVKILGESTMKIYHALIMKQRIIFVGYGHAAQDIAQMVLSTVALIAPPIPNIIRRTFPYANLTDLGFLEVKGYIAGVTNPMFQQHENWWDVLCVLDLPNQTAQVVTVDDRKSEEGPVKGSVANNSKLNLSTAEEAPHYPGDLRFILGVLSGINAHLDEDWVRQQFYDFTTSLLHLTTDKTALLNPYRLDDKHRKFVEANLNRLTTLEMSSEVRDMPKHFWVWAEQDSDLTEAPLQASNTKADDDWTVGEVEVGVAAPSMQIPSSHGEVKTSTIRESSSMNNLSKKSGEDFNGLSLKTKLVRLKLDSSFSQVSEVEQVLRTAERYLITESSLQGFIVLFPESQGGLAPFAAGLFHTSPIIRQSVVIILDRVKSFPSTKAAFDRLNFFVLSAYQRQKRKLEDGTLLEEVRMREVKGASDGGNEPMTPPPEAQDNGISSFFQQTLNMLNDDGEANSDDGDNEPQIQLIH